MSKQNERLFNLVVVNRDTNARYDAKLRLPYVEVFREAMALRAASGNSNVFIVRAS